MGSASYTGRKAMRLLPGMMLLLAAGPNWCAAAVSESLKVTTMRPAAGAKDVCPDVPLKIQFAAAPTLGTGKIQVFDAADDRLVEAIDVGVATKSQPIGGAAANNYYPVTISGNEAAIHLKNHALAYGKTYYATVDAGAFKDAGGDFAGITGKEAWRIDTRAAAPKSGNARLVVAADGSGDFATVQGALDFIPDGNTLPTTILLKKGTYTEMIFLRGKSGVTLVGEDRKGSVIAYSNTARLNRQRSVMQINNCSDFVMANLTVWNTTPKMGGGNQAETIIYGGSLTSRAVLNKVDLKSFQDTLQINDQAFLSDCYIEGDIDFMWGTGPVFFENVTCKMLTSNDSYVETRNPATNHGFVYYHCNFEGAAGVTQAYLAQAVGGCEVVTIDCVMGDWIRPLGWRMNTTGGTGVKYIEFNSHYADGKPIDMSQRAPGARELKQPADAELIANYSNPTWVLGNNWVPMTMRPTAVTVKAGAKMSFSATFGFVPDATYQWQKDGTSIDAGGAVYEVKSAAAADAGVYTLIIKSSTGSVTSAAATVKVE